MDCEVTATTFSGVAEHTLDPKGRVSLPAKARAAFTSKVVKVVLSLDNKKVCIFEPGRYAEWYQSLFPNGFNPLSERDVKLRTRMSMFSEEAAIDSAGRIGISAKLRGIVGLEKDVSIIGMGDHLEVVSRRTCEDLEAELLSINFMEA